MFNTSGHLLDDLLCQVPSSVVTSFPTLRRYYHTYHYYYHHRLHGRRLPLPCWDDLRAALLPHLHAHPAASTCVFFLFFLFCSSILLARFLILRSIRSQQGAPEVTRSTSCRFIGVSDDAIADCYAGVDGPADEDPVSDVVLEGEALLSLSKKETSVHTVFVQPGEDALDSSLAAEATVASKSVYASPVDQLLPPDELEADAPNQVNSPSPNPVSTDTTAVTVEEKKLHKEGKNFSEDGKDLSTVAHDAHLRKTALMPPEEEEENLVSYDTSTVGSTSKSSGERRSSTNLRDSETEHLFSSSSRRSSSKWESYALFRKYDEEMMFLDRIGAQKLNEAESLRSVKVHPRSISQRIVHRLTTRDKQFTRFRDPYRELEAAYVAQICLTWEALNWNYKYFQEVRAKMGEEDGGCSAQMAQQFQQFLVLLQRFNENEPYEHGRRPEVYARMRNAAPKLLQVPEFHDSEGKKDEEDSRISSSEFLRILADAIRTFMNFLRADKENHWQMLRALVKKRTGSVDLALLRLLRKVNEKKRRRLKDLVRRGKCPRSRKPQAEDEMEILMALIDMKIVSRVLRLPEISEEQLRWCEEKMSRLKVWEGKMHRDSLPLFFPAH